MPIDSSLIGSTGGSTSGLTTTGGTVSSSGIASAYQYGEAASKLGLGKAAVIPSSASASTALATVPAGVGKLTLMGVGSILLTGAAVLAVGLLTYAVTKAALEP